MGKRMYKSIIKLLILMLLGIGVLSSCSKARLPFVITNDDSVSDKQAEYILEALENKDSDKLKSMFSQKAFADAEDINSGIDYLMDFLEDKSFQ